MFAAILSLAMFAASPPENVIVDRVACIELNHFHGENGSLAFTQAIFHQPLPDSPRGSDWFVRDWRIIRDGYAPPYFRRNGKAWVLMWIDCGCIRRVEAPLLMETWTQHDREIADRERLPQERRIKLTGAGPPAPANLPTENPFAPSPAE